MLYVMEKISTKPLNVDIPQALTAEVDAILKRRGWIKKRLVGAALAAFIRQGEQQQQSQYEDYYMRYLVDDNSTDDLDGQGDTSHGSPAPEGGGPRFAGGPKVHRAIKAAGKQVRSSRKGKSRRKGTG